MTINLDKIPNKRMRMGIKYAVERLMGKIPLTGNLCTGINLFRNYVLLRKLIKIYSMRSHAKLRIFS